MLLVLFSWDVILPMSTRQMLGTVLWTIDEVTDYSVLERMQAFCVVMILPPLPMGRITYTKSPRTSGRTTMHHLASRVST